MARLSRLTQLMAHDAALLAGLPANTLLIGVDEVGRGSCIGPVSAAAVAFPVTFAQTLLDDLARLNDSKQMKAAHRAHCCAVLETHCTHAYAEASQAEVDAFNVYQASLLAGSRAVLAILDALPAAQPVHLLLDGKALLPGHYQPVHQNCAGFTQQAIIKGDGASFCIAAASVIAKHTRDTLISEWAQTEPRYGWATNMGYPTPAHKAALLTHGPSPYHRQSYKVVQAATQQLTLTV